MSKVKDKLEVYKTRISQDDFKKSNSFRAAMGQRGVNPKEVEERLKPIFETWEDTSLDLNLRFEFKGKAFEVSSTGPTSTAVLKAYYGDISLLRDRAFDMEEVIKVYQDNPSYWSRFSTNKDASLRAIIGKMRSLGGFYEENED